MSQLVKVQFDEDPIECVQQDGRLWVVLRPVCQNLGIDSEGQRQRITRQSWATTCVIQAVAQDGKMREVFAVDLDSLPMWLATIEASRVDEEVRPKLERYQKECARVLRDHFFGQRPAPKTAAEALLAQVQALCAVTQQMVEHDRRLTEHQQLIEGVQGDVAQLKADQEQARRELAEMETAAEKPATKSTRAKVTERVNAYCFANGTKQQDIYRKLYHELKYRYHFDAETRAKNRSKEAGKEVRPIAIVEQEGLIEALWLIVCDLLVLPAKPSAMAAA